MSQIKREGNNENTSFLQEILSEANHCIVLREWALQKRPKVMSGHYEQISSNPFPIPKIQTLNDWDDPEVPKSIHLDLGQ